MKNNEVYQFEHYISSLCTQIHLNISLKGSANLGIQFLLKPYSYGFFLD